MPSKIIKGEDFPEMSERPAPRAPRTGVVDGEVFDAHQRAKEILEQAERQATQIRQKAEDQREEVLAAAREAGRQEGLAQATEVILRARQERARIVEAAEPEIIRLALAVAERIVGTAVQLDEDLVLKISAQAIESVRHQRELVLRVNPEDAVLLRNGRKKLMDMLGRTKDIAVREDPEVERGGCVVETENGSVDAQLRTQIQMIEQALLGGRQVG